MIQKSEQFLNKALEPLIQSLVHSSKEPNFQRRERINKVLEYYARLDASQLETTKDLMWNYANLVSNACVQEDEVNITTEISIYLLTFALLVS